jgi:DNA-binding transcriptional LysR family regulator
MDLDLRKLRYFQAVATELHFGRAAEALHVAQPVLSRQIRALENDLRVQLLARDQRGTQLTAAGEQLLADVGPLLEAAEAVRQRVCRAARGKRFVVGFIPGLIVTGPVRALRGAHEDLEVEVLRAEWDEQVAVILDGRVDIGYIRMPADTRGLRIEPLFAEPRVVVLPKGHHLAGKERVSITDLADDHLLQDPDIVPEWRDVATELRNRHSHRRSPALTNVEEKLEGVAAGRGITVVPESIAAFYRRDDVTVAAITDIGPSEVCLAWDAARRDPLIAEFTALARAAHRCPLPAGEPRQVRARSETSSV